MVNIPFYAKNPIVGATLLFCIMVYSGTVHISGKKKFISFFPKQSIVKVEGAVASSPKMTDQSGNSYSVEFRVKNVQTVQGYTGSASGIIVIYYKSDIASFLYEKGISARIKVIPFKDGFKVITVETTYWNNTFVDNVVKLRADARLFLRQTVSSWGAAGGFFIALIAGTLDSTERMLIESFKTAGLSHVLALSGMHLSILSNMTRFVFRRFFSKRIAEFSEISILSLFMFFAGGAPSLTRAFIFYLMMLILKKMSINTPDAVSVLSFTFLLQSVLFPDDMYTISFILSYLALTGIMVAGPYISLFFNKILPSGLAKPFAESLSAVIFTAPVTIYSFKIIAPGAIFSSFLVSPLISFFMAAGISVFIISAMIPFLSPIISGIMIMAYAIIKKTVISLSEIPVLLF